jgi:plastocyanin
MPSSSRTHALVAAITWVSLSVVATVALALGAVTGSVAHPRGRENLVVFVTRTAEQFPAPTAHAEMDQKRMQFSPFVLPIVVGTTVDFRNHDSVAHNVFSPDAERYNLGTWRPGTSHSNRFNALGVYAQACALHPEMQAYILVLQNPYFAVTKANGTFTMPAMPDGSYEVQVWGVKLSSADKARHFPLKVASGTATLKIVF